MNIALYGTGRAAGSLGLAFSRAGHTITGVEGRSPDAVTALARLVDMAPGTADLVIVAVSDDAIAEVAETIATSGGLAPAVHVSGAVSTAALDPVAATGRLVGSFHPLQTMPDAVNGADQLAGSWIGITAPEPLYAMLEDLAASVGCHSFAIDDESKPLYHAAAAASANFVLASLGVAADLFEASGVPFEASRPLVDAIVANAFALGPRTALTGPIARGDVGTVAKQLEAVRQSTPDSLDDFVALARVTARVAGTSEAFNEVLS